MICLMEIQRKLQNICLTINMGQEIGIKALKLTLML